MRKKLHSCPKLQLKQINVVGADIFGLVIVKQNLFRVLNAGPWFGIDQETQQKIKD
jgi:hypothetical protein